MNKTMLLILCFILAACRDETLTGFAETGQSYQLISVDGADFRAQASIRFDERGTISGVAPCNSYVAGLLVPYPWFELGPIRASRATCREMAAERQFFAALGNMTLAEAVGDMLILSNETGSKMVFQIRSE